MESYLPIVIALLVVLAVAGVCAPRIRAPLPVFLAAIGIGAHFLPGMRDATLDPEWILLVFLPPLLYADAFETSWVDFRRWMRPIVMLAVGLVAVTIFVVGLVIHALLPELPWPVCFVIGAIVSPTDTIAVQAVIERLRVPRRITAILGGESLVNDATGLVGVQIGVAVVLSGTFEAGAVAATFAWTAGGAIAIGVVVGVVFASLNRFVRDTQTLFVLSLIAPYLAFLSAHHLACSGVLAVVVAGFVVAWRFHQVPPSARVDLYATWRLLTYVLNGLCFVFIGLETPRLIEETSIESTPRYLWVGLTVSLVVVLVRFAWVFPSGILPLWLWPRLREREQGYAGWRLLTLTSWCGVRGAVSLAAALAIPMTSREGGAFPGRDAILAITLCVILVTLFVQGTTLLPLVRLLRIREDEGSADDVRLAREAILAAGIARLDAFCTEQSCPLSVHHWRSSMADELTSLRDEDHEQRTAASTRAKVGRDVRRAVRDEQSRELLRLRDGGQLNDRTYLALQLELDRESAVLPERHET